MEQPNQGHDPDEARHPDAGETPDAAAPDDPAPTPTPVDDRRDERGDPNRKVSLEDEDLHPDVVDFLEANDTDGDVPPIVIGDTFQLVLRDDYLIDVFPDASGRTDFAYRVLIPSSSQHVGEGVLPIRIVELLAQNAIAQRYAGEVVWGDVSAAPAPTPISDEFAEAGMPSEPRKGQGQPKASEVSAPPVESSDKPAPVGGPPAQ